MANPPSVAWVKISSIGDLVEVHFLLGGHLYLSLNLKEGAKDVGIEIIADG